MKLTTSVLSIPFKYSFSHAAAERNRSASVFVEINRGRHTGYGEGCPREYVTGESMQDAVDWINSIRDTLQNISVMTDLKDWVATHASEINRHPSAWCAVETAFLDLFGKAAGVPVNDLLNIGRDTAGRRITAVISHGDIPFVSSLIDRCLDFGFRDYKIKLAGNLKSDEDVISLLEEKLDRHCSVRVDFNNAFSSGDIEAFFKYYEKLGYRFSAIEEPFEPYAFTAMRNMAAKIDTPVILDESFKKSEDLSNIEKGEPFIPNIRISKSGGILRTLDLIAAAKQKTERIILGSLVGETSILSRLWLIAADQCGQHLYAGESAYSTHLLQMDVTDHPIIVQPPGVAQIPEEVQNAPGLGIAISPEVRKYLSRQ